MTTIQQAGSATHEVTNQVPPPVDYDVADDAALIAGLIREGGGHAGEQLHRLGRLAGSQQAQEWGEHANRCGPVLHTHDRTGHRIDEVQFHPAWHQLMQVAVSAGLAGSAWADPRPAPHVTRAAGLYVWGQAESGHLCPVSMTYAVMPALRHSPELTVLYEPLLTSRTYDPGLRPPAGKAGLLAGMAMTEKQGGSDVRTNTTTATPDTDGRWRLRGHKWFTSAPMCDLFLVLAQAPGGLSCFLVPRVLPGGEHNSFRIQRLKDKLGNRSNASAEPEFDDTAAFLVGEQGRGLRVILAMVHLTRLDCVIASAAGMRQALVLAGHHATHRSAFGATLIDKPLMRNVLADLALESEAATTLGMRLAGAVDRAAGGDDQERALARLAVAVGKFWVCKRQPPMVAEALECLGGNGYVEDSPMPRLYREAPLNSLWEGSGNVQALDVVRVLTREPNAVQALFAELALADDPRIARGVTALHRELADPDALERRARRLVERLALVLQAALLVRHAPAAVGDAFCASRLADDWGHTFGTLPIAADLDAVLARALPDLG